MRNPTKNGLSISDVESQYDAYLLRRVVYHAPLANFITTLSTGFCRRAFPAGTLTWSKVRFNDFVQFLRASLRGCTIGRLRQLG